MCAFACQVQEESRENGTSKKYLSQGMQIGDCGSLSYVLVFF